MQAIIKTCQISNHQTAIKNKFKLLILKILIKLFQEILAIQILIAIMDNAAVNGAIVEQVI